MRLHGFTSTGMFNKLIETYIQDHPVYDYQYGCGAHLVRTPEEVLARVRQQLKEFIESKCDAAGNPDTSEETRDALLAWEFFRILEDESKLNEEAESILKGIWIGEALTRLGVRPFEGAVVKWQRRIDAPAESKKKRANEKREKFQKLLLEKREQNPNCPRRTAIDSVCEMMKAEYGDISESSAYDYARGIK